MDFNTLIARTGDTVKEHSPAILASLGVAGIATTGFLAYQAGRAYGRAEIEATHILDTNHHTLTGKEKFEMGWKRLVLPMSVGAITALSIVSGATISAHRQAALMSALALTETAFRDYRNKSIELNGKTKEQKVVEAVAQDRVNKAEGAEIVFIGDDKVLCFESLTGRFFESTRTDIEKAEIEINRQILSEMYASQNEWYDQIGLSRVSNGDNIGWNNNTPLEVTFSAVFKDDKPVMAIDYRFQPIIGFHKIW